MQTAPGSVGVALLTPTRPHPSYKPETPDTAKLLQRALAGSGSSVMHSLSQASTQQASDSSNSSSQHSALQPVGANSSFAVQRLAQANTQQASMSQVNAQHTSGGVSALQPAGSRGALHSISQASTRTAVQGVKGYQSALQNVSQPHAVSASNPRSSSGESVSQPGSVQHAVPGSSNLAYCVRQPAISHIDVGQVGHASADVQTTATGQAFQPAVRQKACANSSSQAAVHPQPDVVTSMQHTSKLHPSTSAELGRGTSVAGLNVGHQNDSKTSEAAACSGTHTGQPTPSITQSSGGTQVPPSLRRLQAVAQQSADEDNSSMAITPEVNVGLLVCFKLMSQIRLA